MVTGAFIIPTGIGASIGGFAGDASYWARKFASKCKLIVNPNVVNAACFSGITDNMLYVEGYALDEFFRGNLNLLPACNNSIGVIFDKAIPKPVLNVHLNTINAVKTVYGTNICGLEITDENVGVDFFINKSGVSMGNVSNLATLKKAANKLLKCGADAIAIVCRFPDEQGDDYANGIGVDPVGGVEAIISHYISKELNIPSAHAPAFDDLTINTNLVDSRCAAEYITPTFLPRILLGLSQAPKLSKTDGFKIDDIDFLVLPHNSIGCIPVLEMIKRNKPVYTIKENSTVLNVSPDNFLNKCIICETYSDLFHKLFG